MGRREGHQGVTVMTRHSPAFEAERPVPAGDSVKDLVPDPQKNLSTDAADAPAIKKFNFRRLLMAGAAVAVLAGAVWYGWDYWTVGRFLVSTDDAYVKADNTTIAPKVSGYLQEVLAKDNQRVKAGQVLARIDDRDYRVALDQANVTFAAQDNKRYTDLATTGSGSVQNAQQAQARIASANATLARDTA